MELRRTVDDSGRYFGYFDKIEEAEEFLEKQVRKYLFTPKPKEMSVRRICREAQEKGINLYSTTFRRELERRGIEIRNPRPKYGSKVRRNFTLDEDVVDVLDEYPNGERSSLVEIGIRLVLGVPSEDVIIFLPEEEGETTAIFKKASKRIETFISGDLDRKFEQQIRNLLKRAEKNGMQEVVDYAEKSGFKYFGGTKV